MKLADFVPTAISKIRGSRLQFSEPRKNIVYESIFEDTCVFYFPSKKQTVKKHFAPEIAYFLYALCNAHSAEHDLTPPPKYISKQPQKFATWAYYLTSPLYKQAIAARTSISVSLNPCPSLTVKDEV
jgi:hypothetical protein